jgi:hypothetical protein
MPVLLGCLALMFPRFVIILTVIFSDYIGNAYQTVLWPFLGFIFAPMTTLFYAFAINSNGSVDGLYIAGMVLAVLIDLGMFGGGGKASSRHVASYRAGTVKRVKNTAK